jgi:hypothetical protein
MYIIMSCIIKSLLISVLLCVFAAEVLGDCSMHNDCNGHGTCITSTSTCVCYEGWGAASDITLYRSPDCSLRTCPSSKAWSDVPTGALTAHALAECSNRGTCNKADGTCSCYPGYTGDACQRTACPNNCSGHGVCVSLKQMARMDNALPLAPNTYYEGDDEGVTWDDDKIFGCVCDSSWSVGLGSGQRQEPEWFGPDCSLRHCPSGNDPRTFRDETDCRGRTAKDSIYAGQPGNLCQVDCSNRGICDYTTGICQCFDGQYGQDCSINDPNAVYSYWNTHVEQVWQ